MTITHVNNFAEIRETRFESCHGVSFCLQVLPLQHKVGIIVYAEEMQACHAHARKSRLFNDCSVRLNPQFQRL
jgi:hypothetical protein